jgi:hypothetical protein
LAPNAFSMRGAVSPVWTWVNWGVRLPMRSSLFLSLGAALVLDVSVHPDSEGGFVEGSGSKVEDGLRGVFFGGRKAAAIHFEEQDTDDKARAFIPIDKGVVADNAASVSSSQVYEVRVVPVGMELLRPSEGGFEQSFIAHARRAAFEGQKAIVKGEGVPLVYPDRLPHLASAWSVLR